MDTASCSDLLKLLADQTRLAIIEELILGAKHVRSINEKLNIEQSLLSHHLKLLREAGLVSSQRDGKSVLYSILEKVKLPKSNKAINLGCCNLSFN